MSTHGFQGKAVQVVMFVCSLSRNWPVIILLLWELRVVLVLFSHLPLHSHPISTSQKRNTILTFTIFYFIAPACIASVSPNKGTSDLEIRSVTISTTNIWALRKWTLKREFTFYPTGPWYIKIQDTSSDMRRFPFLEVITCRDITALGLRFLTQNWGKSERRLRTHPSLCPVLNISEENDQGPGNFLACLIPSIIL